MIIIAIVLVILIGLLIFSRDFRRWLGDTLQAIALLIAAAFPAVSAWLVNAVRVIGRVIGIYSLILAGTTLFALVLIIVALIINAPAFTAFAFVLALTLVLLAWLPAGIVLKLFRINNLVIPKLLKMIIAWVAFVGFLGLMCPDIITFRSLMGAALIGFILLGVTTRINALDKIVFPLVVVMCLTVAWKHFFPEDFRSTVRYAQSWSKRANTAKDRGSINNETDAAVTYGVVLRDVNILYTLLKDKKSDSEILTEEEIILKRGTIVKFASHKQEIKEIDGQGFAQIQLAKANGSFVNGKKYWVEAEYVMTANPREITPKDESLLPVNQPRTNQPISAVVSPRDSIFTKGVYQINVKGVTPYNIVIVPSRSGCARYSLSSGSYNYQIIFPGESPIQANPNLQLQHRERPVFQLSSQTGDVVTLTVA